MTKEPNTKATLFTEKKEKKKRKQQKPNTQVTDFEMPLH